MTPGNNGASTPEDDDPFGYLYADGQANGATPPSGGGGYGYPGSVNRVRAVGERQYGQQNATAAYGQVPQQQTYGQQQPGYGQPHAHYAAPETVPGGAVTSRQAPVGGGRGRGPNTKGLLIGAIAVVAAVVIGITVVMVGGDSDDDKNGSEAGSTPTAAQSAEPSKSAGQQSPEAGKLPTIDAKALKLDGGATTASDVEGAKADGGIYVSGLSTVGAQVTWTVNGIPKDGLYTVFARYNVVGENQSMTVTVNNKTFGSKLNLGNFTGATDPAKGWMKTYAWPTLTKGTNTISISCQDGDKCNILLDQLWLKAGKVKD